MIVLRAYKAEDVAELLALYYDVVHTINSKDYSEEQGQAWMPSRFENIDDRNNQFHTCKTIVAEQSGTIVGFGNLERNLSAIGMLYVHKDFQGMGIATLILNKLEEALRLSGISNATAEVSITAKQFFTARGYTEVRENRKMLNGVEFLNFIMEKAL
jgi:putative acetyltransferase